MQKDEDLVAVKIAGLEGDIHAGLEECHASKCSIMLGGPIYAMTLQVGKLEPKLIHIFCSQECYFEKLVEVDAKILRTGAQHVYEVGDRR